MSDRVTIEAATPVSDQDQFAKWKRFASVWSETGPPSIPSPHDLTNFEHVLSVAPSGPILLLGSTKSIRSMLRARPDVSSWICVDFCSDMFNSQSRDLKPDSREEYVQLDWLDIDQLNSVQATTVLGDKILDNIEQAAWPRFFQRLRRVVADDALIALHVAWVPTAYMDETFDSSMQRAIKKLDRGVNYSNVLAEFWEDLLVCSAFHTSSSRLSVGVYSDDLRERASVGAGNQRKLASDFLQVYGAELDDYWTKYTEEDLQLLETSDLNEVNRLYSADYPTAKESPIIVLQYNN